MSPATPDPAVRFSTIARTLQRMPRVTVGSSKKKCFGSSALCVGDKIFAMISSSGAFVVKLSKARVDALVASGSGTRFVPSPGRVMKEWLAVAPDADEDWLALAREAMAFVASKQ